jgi:hypothetical protein
MHTYAMARDRFVTTCVTCVTCVTQCTTLWHTRVSCEVLLGQTYHLWSAQAVKQKEPSL